MSFRDSIERAWRDNNLLSVLIELTYRCNLDCTFCYNDVAFKGQPLRLEHYEQLLDDLAAMNVLTVILSGGEPLTHPHFFEIGRMARERGFVVRIKSNGHALKGELARRVRDEVQPFLIEVSLHGAKADTHDRLTRVPGSFDTLVQNIREMRGLGLRVKANSTLTQWNQDELPEMFALAESLGITLQLDPEVKPRDNGDLSPLDIAPTTEGVAKMNAFFKARRAELDEELNALPRHLTAPADLNDKHCGAGASNLAVDPYGNVLPCVQWRRPIGNLHQTSILTMWQSSNALREVRNITRDVRGEVAEKAKASGAFAFCPGLAELQSGSPRVPGFGPASAPTLRVDEQARVHLPLIREAS